MQLSFETYDVFTSTRYRGNPLAVVTIPASDPKPTQEQKQAIAAEFNLSETIFIHDAPSSSARAVDIFITNAELPFAGHPTIGAAVSLLSSGANIDTIVTKAGPIPVGSTGTNSAQASIPFNVHLHSKTLGDVQVLPDSLSGDEAVRAAELKAPFFSIVKGMNFALVELPDVEALGQTRTRALSSQQDVLDEDWKVGFVGHYYFVRMGTSTTVDGVPVVSLRTRMIEATLEDPATGSAASALCCYLSTAAKEQTVPVIRYEITQGVEMGRESNIVVQVTLKDGSLENVALSGAAVKVMSGILTI